MSSVMLFPSFSMVGLFDLLVFVFPPVQGQPVLIQLAYLTSGREAKSWRVISTWSYLVMPCLELDPCGLVFCVFYIVLIHYVRE